MLKSNHLSDCIITHHWAPKLSLDQTFPVGIMEIQPSAIDLTPLGNLWQAGWSPLPYRSPFLLGREEWRGLATKRDEGGERIG